MSFTYFWFLPAPWSTSSSSSSSRHAAPSCDRNPDPPGSSSPRYSAPRLRFRLPKPRPVSPPALAEVSAPEPELPSAPDSSYFWSTGADLPGSPADFCWYPSWTPPPSSERFPPDGTPPHACDARALGCGAGAARIRPSSAAWECRWSPASSGTSTATWEATLTASSGDPGQNPHKVLKKKATKGRKIKNAWRTSNKVYDSNSRPNFFIGEKKCEE